jgi:hypothetical protein
VKVRASLAAALAFAGSALGACDDGAPSQNVTRVTIANPESDRLKTMSPLYQRIGLSRAVRDSGKRCRRVDALGYQQEYRGLAMWVALCEDGRHWAVFIAPNSDVQVRECIHNAELRLPVCRPVAPLPPDPNAPPNSNRPGNGQVGNSE